MMEIIAHRVNTVKELDELPAKYGVEIDLRDGLDGRIYLQHEPFIPGEDFEEYLKHYHHGTMILNVKSERIEYKILELLQKYGVTKYFFLDSTFPMIKTLSGQGEKNIALRFSELEGLDTIRNMQGLVSWVWIDCFTKYPVDDASYKELRRMGYKLCLVSPELEGHQDWIGKCKHVFFEQYKMDAVCTDTCHFSEWE